ncbi:tachykinin-like peptides receptor 86C [Tachypleus tridentatus]|uniref:tachykinin-like peptides receptor 86C n=1 Tax=Tachypleus tridentatus TaxID=6853 RepID=UPI003FD4B7D5
MSKSKVLVLIGAIWICSVSIAFPTLLYSTTHTYNYGKDGDRILCYLHWPDGPSGISTADYVYNIVFLSLTYAVPMISMGIAYTFMGHALWGGKAIGEITERHKEVIKSKKKVVRMLIVIVLIFAICWLPYHVFFLYTYHYPETAYTDYVQPMFLVFYWLAMSNSVYNPIIYYWANKRFKGYFQSILCCRKNLQLTQRQTRMSSRTKPRRLIYRLRYLSWKRSTTSDGLKFIRSLNKNTNGGNGTIDEVML